MKESDGAMVENVRGEKATEIALDKLESIENTVEKSLVRDDIDFQRHQFINYLLNDYRTGNWEGKINGWLNCADELPYKGMVLGGANFFNERLAINSAKRSFGSKVVMRFDSAEYDPNVFLRAVKRLPENCTIVHGEFDALTDNKTEYRSYGIGRVMDDRKDGLADCPADEIWADYCMTASKEMAKSSAKHIAHNIDRGLYYLTMFVGCRQKGGVDYKFGKLKAICNSKSNDPAEIMADLIRHYLMTRQEYRGEISLVYNVRYNGGANGSSIMVTLGFAVNLPKNLITPIIENRQEIEQKRKSRMNNHYFRLKREGVDALFTDERGRPPTKSKTVPVCDKAYISLCRKIYKRWAKGVPNKKIAAQLGVSARQVGSTIAWLSPKHVAKAKGIKLELLKQAKALRKKTLLAECDMLLADYRKSHK